MRSYRTIFRTSIFLLFLSERIECDRLTPGKKVSLQGENIINKDDFLC